ncbi:hypothetical protein R1flu_011438 [Riccia fluitans]|uniref:Uncharacterized protein n=1 Tax=Riccia fluitans TaxID=41844 RepID=A0ABD1Z7T7_9MARC
MYDEAAGDGQSLEPHTARPEGNGAGRCRPRCVTWCSCTQGGLGSPKPHGPSKRPQLRRRRYRAGSLRRIASLVNGRDGTGKP